MSMSRGRAIASCTAALVMELKVTRWTVASLIARLRLSTSSTCQLIGLALAVRVGGEESGCPRP
jgi:hypothetical protein